MTLILIPESFLSSKSDSFVELGEQLYFVNEDDGNRKILDKSKELFWHAELNV